MLTHPDVPTDAILISRLELTDDERVLLSREINAAGDFIRRINRILAGRPIAAAPVESWDDPPASP